ncbi:DUF2971 domain-containing protein [Scandinavium sp. M-37]|uniref:DUF2971 domain-containing protein n=1 Tax=Scandinavium sp. M-37 TaxID=3373077 RepID=UPI0037467A81
MNVFFKLRNTSSLLNGFHELENQELFFASPDELNDPQEGFLNLFWQGDKIVWRNLLRYYIFNLTNCLLKASCSSNESLLSSDLLLFNFDINNGIDRSFRNTYNALESTVFRINAINELITCLSEKNKKIHQDELFFILNSLHLLIIKEICIELNKLQHNTLFEIISKMDCYTLDPNFIDAISSDFLPTIAAMHKNSALESNLTIFENQTNIVFKKNYHYLLQFFAQEFVNQLGQLTYNDVYITCFTKNYPDSDMWGYYGDNHKGCCLIFETTTPEYLDSYTRNPEDNVIKITRTGGTKPIDMKIEPVNYSGNYPEINFFNSVGNIQRGIYQNCWLSDGEERSHYYDHRYVNHHRWLDEYNHNMHSFFFCKTEHWSKENEARAIITTFSGENDIANRKVRYEFQFLKGIVFGIKTSYSDKCEIVNILVNKCDKYHIFDFKFYQAFYNHKENKMDKVEIDIKHRR